MTFPVPAFRFFGHQKFDFSDSSSTFTFKEVDAFVGTLTNISLTFAMNAERFEEAFIQLTNNDRLYRLNQSPNNQTIKSLQILERRLKVLIIGNITFCIFYLNNTVCRAV